MALTNTLKQFCSIFGREGNDIGEISFNSETKQLPLLEVEINNDLKTFYSMVNFQNLIIGGELFLEIFSYDMLIKAQEGWGVITDHPTGNQAIDNENWPKEWVVFADRNGDAIFTKQDLPNYPVFGSIQKTRNLFLANSLDSFFKILNACLLLEQEKFNFNTQTDDFAPKDEFVEAVFEIVANYSDSESDPNEFIEFFFG